MSILRSIFGKGPVHAFLFLYLLFCFTNSFSDIIIVEPEVRDTIWTSSCGGCALLVEHASYEEAYQRILMLASNMNYPTYVSTKTFGWDLFYGRNDTRGDRFTFARLPPNESLMFWFYIHERRQVNCGAALIKKDMNSFDRTIRAGQWCVVDCPPGSGWNELSNSCESCEAGSDLQGCPKEQLGDSCSMMTSNPVNIATGNKYYRRIDFQGNGSFPLKVERHYNSFAGKWSWHFRHRINIIGTSPRIAEVIRSDGNRYSFRELDGGWIGDPNSVIKLSQRPNGFQLVTKENGIEHYDSQGRLISITNRHGKSQILTYETNQINVVGPAGNSLVFRLDNQDRVEKITAGNSREYRYKYDEAGNLVAISFPDDTENQSGSNPFSEDNPFEYIHYEDPSFPRHITGITDENGDRFSTVEYDSVGRAIMSELKDGAERTVLDFTNLDDLSDRRVIVSNELGKDTTYHLADFQGSRKVTQVDGHQSANCAAANKYYTYYPNGLIKTKTDWKNHTISYEYNTRNLESFRTEALGTPQERVTITNWHPTFNLRTKITEPGKETVFTYDAQGRLLSQVSNALPLQ